MNYHVSAEYFVANTSDFSKVKEKDMAEVIKERADHLRAKVKIEGQEKAIKGTLSTNRQTPTNMETACAYFTKLTCAAQPFTSITIH